MRDAAEGVMEKRAVLAVAVMDALEPRRLLSVDIDVTPWEGAWGGVTGGAAVAVGPVTMGGVTWDARLGRYNAVVRPGVDFAGVAARQGFTEVRPLGGNLYSFSSTRTPAQLQALVRRSPNLLAVSPDFVMERRAVPNDPAFSAQYHLQNTGQAIPSPLFVPEAEDGRTLGVPGEDIGIVPAWDVTTGDGNVVIAILDTGLDVGHGDLAANIWVNPFEVPGDGIDNDGNGFVDDINGWDFGDGNNDLTDTDGHGTAVAGVAAAVGNNGKGVTGVAWNAKLMGVKVFASRERDSLSAFVSDFVAGVNYVTDMALRGVPVAAANASLGFPTFFFDPVVTAALRRLSDAGVVFVGAAGNSADDNDRLADFPTRNSLLIPGNLSVAATDNRGELAVFSSYGNRTVQVAAPGVGIFTTGSRDADPSGMFIDADGDRYLSADGTSFAAPIVAGLAALARSVAPQASPAEIADAILRGVDVLPSLLGATAAAPRKVSTGGRVNVANTLQILTNRVVGTNATSAGDWVGRFGAAGQLIYGAAGAGTLPGLVSSAVPGGASVEELRVRRGSIAGLLLPEQGFVRSASAVVSDEPLRFDFDFTATGSRRVTLYMADLDGRNRVQRVRVINSDTGLELAATTLQRFQNGQYVTLELTGRVSVEVVPLRGSAVVNGMFLDAVPSSPAAVVRTDAVTGGNWVNVYGDQGYVLPGLQTVLPAGVTLTSSANTVVLPGGGRDRWLPESPAAAGARSAGVLTAAGPFDVQVSVGAAPREVSFYLVNPGRAVTAQRVQLLDGSGGVAAQQDVTLAPRSGAYVTLRLTGSNTLRFHSLGAVGSGASLAGVFFNSSNTPGSPQGTKGFFVGSNSTLGGRWRGSFGLSGQWVVGAQTGFPAFVSSTPAPSPAGSGSITLLSGNTGNVAAPQNPNLTRGNLVGYLQTQGTTSLPVSIADGTTRRLTAYFVDFDRRRRVQRVELVDATTGQVLSSQLMRDFQRGKYLSWEVSGSVAIRLTRLEGPSAVLSAVFFD